MSSNWWKSTLLYHVYINSFKDGNDDGIGDFLGLTSELDYFQYLGGNITLLLSPINAAPLKDNGYAICDYCDIDPTYGTLNDFENFMAKVKERDLHVVLDLIVNHTSNEHSWFKKSVDKLDPYTDYYVWADPKEGEEPPNNWKSVYNTPAWEYNPKRKQYYFHQFLVEQPDLNWRNRRVRLEIENVLKFWLHKGVDGFRLSSVSHLLEDELMRDEPAIAEPKCYSDQYEYFDHIYTKGLEENVTLVKEWRKILNEVEKSTGNTRIILTEAYEPVKNLMPYYGELGERISDVPFNTKLLELDRNSSANDLQALINTWLDAMPEGKTANWIVNNYDQHDRFASRIGPTLLPGIHMITALLPGILFCYYGDEIGMEALFIEEKIMKDSLASGKNIKNSRDPVRTPMQWNDSENAGFTKSPKPWLPIHDNYKFLNVENQKKNPVSNLEIFKGLLALRNEQTVKEGIVEFPLVDGNIFTMIRCKPKLTSYLVIVNMGNCLTVVDLSGKSEYLPKSGSIKISNNRYFFDKSCSPKDYVKGNFSPQYGKAYELCSTASKDVVVFNTIVLFPKESMVINFLANNVPPKATT